MCVCVCDREEEEGNDRFASSSVYAKRVLTFRRGKARAVATRESIILRGKKADGRSGGAAGGGGAEGERRDTCLKKRSTG